jgi:hypothetical protein
MAWGQLNGLRLTAWFALDNLSFDTLTIVDLIRSALHVTSPRPVPFDKSDIGLLGIA